MSLFFKLAAVVGMCALGWGMDGSYKGALAWLLIIVVGYAIISAVNAGDQAQVRGTARLISRPEDFTDYPNPPSRRGERLNPDPTRPTTDDYAGLITTYIERKRGN
jgi:hypothetical protein